MTSPKSATVAPTVRRRAMPATAQVQQVAPAPEPEPQILQGGGLIRNEALAAPEIAQAPDPELEQAELAAIRVLTIDVVMARLAKNAASSQETAATKKLATLVAQARQNAPIEITVAGKLYAVGDAAATTNVVDVALLKGLVDEATFMRIISATQAAVKHEVGDALLSKTLVPQKGELKFGVREV